ncbi:MAG: hypothetical protein ACE14L_06010 [Terriglobales bacterium]
MAVLIGVLLAATSCRSAGPKAPACEAGALSKVLQQKCSIGNLVFDFSSPAAFSGVSAERLKFVPADGGGSAGFTISGDGPEILSSARGRQGITFFLYPLISTTDASPSIGAVETKVQGYRGTSTAYSYFHIGGSGGEADAYVSLKGAEHKETPKKVGRRLSSAKSTVTVGITVPEDGVTSIEAVTFVVKTR